MRDNLSNDATIWVVAKLIRTGEFNEWDEYSVEVEEMGFSDKSYAEKRAKHITDNDGMQAFAFPIRAVWATPVFRPGAWTTSQGREMVAYHVPGRDGQPRLSQIVSDVWTSWRQQQADAGNLDEAGLEQPLTSELEALYQETDSTASEPAASM